MRKGSVENQPLMMIENEIVPYASVHLKPKIENQTKPKQNNKSLQRYQNSSMIDQYKNQIEKLEEPNKIALASANRRKEVDHQKLKRYAEVNASVEEHLRKFEYLIPDLRRKKFDLLTQILGEKDYEDIQAKLKNLNNK